MGSGMKPKRVLFSCNFCGTVCSSPGRAKHLKKYHRPEVNVHMNFTRKEFDAL